MNCNINYVSVLIPLCLGGTAEQNGNVEEPPCRLECKSLSMADYTDLLLTTAAEFPG